MAEFFQTLWGKVIGTLTVISLIIGIYIEIVSVYRITIDAETAAINLQKTRAETAVAIQHSEMMTSPSPVMGEEEAHRELCSQYPDNALCRDHKR